MEDGHDEGEEVEVAEFGDVEGVHEGLARDAVGHDGGDLMGPGELGEDEDAHDHEDRVSDEALDGVGHEERDATAAEDDEDGEGKARGEHEGEGRDDAAEEFEAVRDAEQVDEEADGDGGADAVGEGVGGAAQDAGEAADAAGVAHFEELAAAHRAGFAEAVANPAEQAHHDG